MHWTRAFGIVTAATICLGAVAACSETGNSDNKTGKDYCTLVKEFDAADSADGDMPGLIARIKTVREGAPTAQQKEWDKLSGYMQKLYDARDDQAKAAEIVADTGAVRKASEAIAKHAKDACGIEIKTK
ncbi:hypothetical protein [Kribbella deserti]|uniref:Lipoprotein n=1 Tax=Kribbella deserti TaxID=1926257 RepID=A0ABV6QPG2_9ACTN